MNPATEIAYMRFDREVLDVRDILASITRAGYHGVPLRRDGTPAGGVDSSVDA